MTEFFVSDSTHIYCESQNSSPSSLEVLEVLECNFSMFRAIWKSFGPVQRYWQVAREIFSKTFGF